MEAATKQTMELQEASPADSTNYVHRVKYKSTTKNYVTSVGDNIIENLKTSCVTDAKRKDMLQQGYYHKGTIMLMTHTVAHKGNQTMFAYSV